MNDVTTQHRKKNLIHSYKIDLSNLTLSVAPF